MDEAIKKSIEAAQLEFEKEPMDDYYENFIVGIMSRRRVQKILKELGDINGKKILDVGCEAGYVSLQISKLGGTVYSIDIVKEAVQLMKKKIEKERRKNIFAFAGSAHDLMLKDCSIDTIICTEVIEHTPKLNNVFGEFARVLKPGGKLIVTFPNEGFRKIFYPIIAMFGINTEVEKEVTLFSYQFEDIINKCKDSFKIQKVYSIPWFFPLTRFILCEK